MSIALEEVGLVGRLVSTDGRVGGLTLNFLLPENSDLAVIEITDHINALLTEARVRHPDISYYLTGDVVMNRVLAAATAADFETLVPIVFLIIVVSSALLLKSILATLAIVTMFVLVIVGTMGFAGWTGQVFSPASAGVPIIVMAIAVAHAVHIVTSTLAGLRGGGGPGGGDPQLASDQCLPGLPGRADDHHRISEPECLGFPTFPRSGQHGGVWPVVHVRLLDDLSAGPAFDSAVAPESDSG